MIAVTPWMDRKFSFTAPTSMFPQFVERLRGTPARIEDLVRNLSQAELQNRIPQHWSIQEEIGHLLELEELWATRLEQFCAGEASLKAWPGNNDATWNAQYNRKRLPDILDDFRGSRYAFVSRFEAIPDDVLERIAFHPRVKRQMRTVDLASYVCEHDDHHLATISAMKRVLISSFQTR